MCGHTIPTGSRINPVCAFNHCNGTGTHNKYKERKHYGIQI